MSRNSKYDSLLLQEAKRGRNNSYINLATIYLHKIFSLTFELIPIKEQAVNISSDVLSEMWFGLGKIEDLNGFINSLERTVILKCVNFLSKNNIELLNDDLINNLSSELNIPILPIEREIFKLNTFERICVVLVDQVGLNIDFVSRLYKEKELNEILETLNNTRQKLIRKFPSEIYTKFNDEQWSKINLYLKTTLSEETLEIDDNLIKLVSNYEACSIEIMQDLLRHLIPDQKIIENLRDFIFIEDSKRNVIDKNFQDLGAIKKPKKEKINYKYDKQRTFSKKTFIKIIGFFVIIFVLSAAYFFISNLPESWKISDEIALVILNGKNAKTNELKEGDKITTASSRTTEILCDKKASLKILENSDLLLSKVTSSENIFELKSGAIKFNSAFESTEEYEQDGNNYKIMFDNSEISTKKSMFSLSLNAASGFYLVMNKGWLKLTMKKYNHPIFCVNNYNIKYDNSYSLVLPYNISASEEFIIAINQLSKIPTDESSLRYIINNARGRDALTLWHLLSISDSAKIKLILKKLDQILLFDLVKEFDKTESLSEKTKHDLLKFIISDLLMRSDD
ncbi:MAG: hypothetical protein KKF62_12375 [Bacteroidetes bacterium]|nr:hypothetical protein [Bacteroidota bacterium]MBU1799825.1 hypothetical protein [Bacteroidota bacterium]